VAETVRPYPGTGLEMIGPENREDGCRPSEGSQPRREDGPGRKKSTLTKARRTNQNQETLSGALFQGDRFGRFLWMTRVKHKTSEETCAALGGREASGEGAQRPATRARECATGPIWVPVFAASLLPGRAPATQLFLARPGSFPSVVSQQRLYNDCAIVGAGLKPAPTVRATIFKLIPRV